MFTTPVFPRSFRRVSMVILVLAIVLPPPIWPTEPVIANSPVNDITVGMRTDYLPHWSLIAGSALLVTGISISICRFATRRYISQLTSDWQQTKQHLQAESAACAQVQSALQHDAEEITDLYENAPIGYHSLDSNGVFVRINATELNWLGYSAEELLGRKRFIDLLDPVSLPTFERNFPIFKTQGVVRDLIFILRRKDGSQLPVLLSATAVRDTQGRFLMSRSTVYDITERTRIETELTRYRENLEVLVAERTERYELVLAGAQGAIWDWDLRQHRIHVSPQWQALRGLDHVGDQEEFWQHDIHPDDLARVRAALEAHLLGLTPVFAEEYRIRCQDGNCKWVINRGLAQRDANGQAVRMAGSEIDISERKRIETALREQDRHKDEFLAMLAHELRNPLTPIRNAVHIMGLVTLDDPRLQQVRDILDRQVTHLTCLVDDLLDISRIARGKVVLHRKPLTLADWVNQAVEVARPSMEVKRQRLDVQLPAATIWLEADRVRLVQVLLNLLNNASKFTPETGLITISAAVSNHGLELSVRDNGRGISAALLPHVFDLFFQGERRSEDAESGLGIGLTLVQRLITLHSGRVKATSAGLGLGTTFTLWLPQAQAPATATPMIADTTVPNIIKTALRILVVDDERLVAESTALWLQLEGHQVEVAYSGAMALEMVPSFHPQVVLLDLGMPGMNGYETATHLRALPEGAALYLVATTGYSDQETHTQVQTSGFDRQLIKPFDLFALREVLSAMVIRV